MNSGNFALRIPKMFNRYKEPAIIPQIPVKMDLFHDDSKSWTPARYVNDLSEKWTPNTPNLFVTGISKKKGTKEANTRAYGPDVSRFAVGSLVNDNKMVSSISDTNPEKKMKTEYLFEPICLSKTRKKYSKYKPESN